MCEVKSEAGFEGRANLHEAEEFSDLFQLVGKQVFRDAFLAQFFVHNVACTRAACSFPAVLGLQGAQGGGHDRYFVMKKETFFLQFARDHHTSPGYFASQKMGYFNTSAAIAPPGTTTYKLLYSS